MTRLSRSLHQEFSERLFYFSKELFFVILSEVLMYSSERSRRIYFRILLLLLFSRFFDFVPSTGLRSEWQYFWILNCNFEFWTLTFEFILNTKYLRRFNSPELNRIVLENLREPRGSGQETLNRLHIFFLSILLLIDHCSLFTDWAPPPPR